MTAAAQLEVAGSGRSAPSDGHLNPHRNEGGKSAKPAAVLPSNVCNFRLSEVRNFRLTLTGALQSRQASGVFLTVEQSQRADDLRLLDLVGVVAGQTQPVLLSQ